MAQSEDHISQHPLQPWVSHGPSSIQRLGGFLRRQQRTRRAVFSHVSFLLSGAWVDSSVSETSLSLGGGGEASGVCCLRGTQSQRWVFSTDVGLRCERSSWWAPDIPTDTYIPLTTDTQDTQVARSSSRDPGMEIWGEAPRACEKRRAPVSRSCVWGQERPFRRTPCASHLTL